MIDDILLAVGHLIADGKVGVSLHAVDELSKDGLLIEPLIDDFANGIAVEEYPAYHKGPCVLVLQRDEFGLPVHLLWGIPAGKTEPAVLITAYRPDPDKWNDDFTVRRSK
ncbi:DUF4258 domain-containing protein [Pararhizobium sp. YC-54]|uniref:DUF4258 domain-containing protein n=1 Tax=Pararhizobium sp. YC-54 TaxID=2986920 RepID=UPI0021F7FA76|nr:DUF4258 domain-containing protein [Pararhizobium sp. YC-54]MCV9997036.1 DUF4258 domain-containing protein [Pararhizobium sp. YC-54]